MASTRLRSRTLTAVLKTSNGWWTRATSEVWLSCWMWFTTIWDQKGTISGTLALYFTDRYRSPWGQAINFDGAHSDEVRRFFIENALYWVMEFHVDALRIDAVHAILDFSAKPFLQELAEAVHCQAELLNRRVYLISESNLNDARLVRAPELGGFGLDAQWNDDFHHALHSLLTGERAGYYEDFGEIRHLAKGPQRGICLFG